MLIEVADLITKIPEEGGIAPLLEKYKTNRALEPDIVIDASIYRKGRLECVSDYIAAYMGSGSQFHYWLLRFGGMMLHASAVELGGRAFLFSGPSGMGKSTHTRLWQEVYPDARIFNDDKPALRCIDGRWFAYGTPWSGKNHVNINIKVPLAGICFLKRGSENSIRRLSPPEAIQRLIHQTMRVFNEASELDLMLSCVERIVADIPIYELHALPDSSAARLSHDTMFDSMTFGAEDLNL